jgi:hypothetical protein
LVALLLLLFDGALAVAQPSTHRIVDPFFLIEYDPTNVHFDTIPPLIENRCPQLRGYYVKAWVYGHLKTHESEYFIVDGYVKIESEDHPGHFSVVQDDGYGYIIEIRAGGCVVEATPYVFFPDLNKGKNSAAKLHISDAVLAAISAELLERYARAFGGKNQFLKKIKTSGLSNLPSLIKKQLEEFDNQRQSH